MHEPVGAAAFFPANAPIRSRLSRDCYDVCRMAGHPAGRKAMSRSDLLERVVNHKRAYFRSSWANHETARPGSMRLVPPEHRLADLRVDYQRMREMFTEPPPLFESILQQLRSLEDIINSSAC
jgi:hypothetical protein